MPKQINTPWPGRGLVRLFDLKGRFQPVLDETIVPVTIIDQSTTRNLCIGGIRRTASGAGNQNKMFLENPPGSNVLMRLQGWNGVSGAPLTDFLNITLIQGTAGAGGTNLFRDGTLNGLPKVLFSGATAGAAVLGVPSFHLENDDNMWEQEWILGPNSYLEFLQSAQNQTIDLFWIWTEEPLTPTLRP